jgi:cytochrome P450
MLLAGEDTTANTVAWMMHFMCEHPDVQLKMQREADTVLGQADTLREMADADQLTYVDAVTQETMRLKPVTPVLFLETNEEVDPGGIRLPKATAIMLLTRYSNLQESRFAAAHEFQPERWLSDQSTSSHHHNGFVPFGSGPRLCPGRSLALYEIKTAVAMICRNFHLTKAASARPVGENFAFTLMPTNLLVDFRSRTHPVST